MIKKKFLGMFVKLKLMTFNVTKKILINLLNRTTVMTCTNMLCIVEHLE
jgi:hypothetical protein